MRTEVYSWRLSKALKADLEREARSRKTSVSSLLETAATEWLKSSSVTASDDGHEQLRLHASVAPCLGSFAGRNNRRAETARLAIRESLRRRYGR